MKVPVQFFATFMLGAFLGSCSSHVETRKEAHRETPESKEEIYQRGHQLYLLQQYDSAVVLLQQASGLDGKYKEPLSDLAQLYYEKAFRDAVAEKDQRVKNLRRSREYFMKLESLGENDSDIFERICEISHELDDDAIFLKYAKKHAEFFPYDRQYANLGYAYYQVADYQNVIRSQKEAVSKFKGSPFIGTYYRQMGQAYLKVDRDQTAERTFDAGLVAIDQKLAELRKESSDFTSSKEFKRLRDDRMAMLVSLKKLHQTYGASDKLEKVEKLLQKTFPAH